MAKAKSKNKPSVKPLRHGSTVQGGGVGAAGGQHTQSVASRRPVRTALSSRALASLVQPEAKDIGELADSMDDDYQVMLAKMTLYANVSAIKIEIEPTGTDPRGRLLANQLKTLWCNHLAEMCDCIARGRVAFEKLWAYNAQANVNYVPKLQSLPYRQTAMKLVNGTGDFDGITLEHGGANDSDKDGGTLTIPADNSWWLALDATAIQPHGKSRYSGAPYVVWKERQQAIRLRKLFIQRLVLMGGVAHVPEKFELENGQELDAATEMAKAHDERISGAMVVLPNTRDASGSYEYEITDPPSTLDPAPLDNHIDGLDQEQLQAFGIPPKVVIEGDSVGSFAMVSQQRLILDAVIEHILNQIVRSFQKYVIDKVVERTFLPGSGTKITIGFKSLLDQQSQIIAQTVETILTSPQLGQILESGVVDVYQMLEDSRIPLLPGAKVALQKLFQKAMEQSQQPPPAVPGAAPGTPPRNQPPLPAAPAVAATPAVPVPGIAAPPQPPRPADLANPYHDPRNGQFTDAATGSLAHIIGLRDSAPKHLMFGGDKVYIKHFLDNGVTPKQLWEHHVNGHLEMSRADLVERMDPALLRASEIHPHPNFPDIRFHFVRKPSGLGFSNLQSP